MDTLITTPTSHREFFRARADNYMYRGGYVHYCGFRLVFVVYLLFNVCSTVQVSPPDHEILAKPTLVGGSIPSSELSLELHLKFHSIMRLPFSFR
jgi:hypothetical protein